MVGFFNFGSFGAGGSGPVETVFVIDSSGSIKVAVGSTQDVDITCNQDISSLSLSFVVETLSKVDVATVATGSIVKAGDVATLSLTSAMTASERTLRWTMINTSNGEAVASGLMFVTYDAQGD